MHSTILRDLQPRSPHGRAANGLRVDDCAYPYRPVRVLLAAIQQRIADLGAEVIGNTPQEFSAQIKRERKKWEGVVKGAGIKAE